MSKSFTLVMTVTMFALGALSIGCLIYALRIGDVAEKDIATLNLRSRFDISTMRRLSGLPPARLDASNLQSLKEQFRENESAQATLQSLENKRTALMENKRAQSKKPQFQAFEQESTKLTGILSNEAIANVKTLRDLAVAGSVLSAILAATCVTLIRRDTATSYHPRTAPLAIEKLKNLESILLAHLRAVMFQIDEQLVFHNVGKSSRAIWGYEPEELAAKPITDFIRLPESRIRALLDAARAEKMEQTIDCEFQTKSGQQIRMQWLISNNGRKDYRCIAIDSSTR